MFLCLFVCVLIYVVILHFLYVFVSVWYFCMCVCVCVCLHAWFSCVCTPRLCETVVPLEDPIITETTSTLQEWAVLWKQLYVVSHALHLSSLISHRSELLIRVNINNYKQIVRMCSTKSLRVSVNPHRQTQTQTRNRQTSRN